LIEEFGYYDPATAVLSHDDTKVYEIKPGLSETIAAALGQEAGPSFHFVLNDTIYSDNRIPPRGFTNAAFEAIQSPPVGYTYKDGQYTDTTRYTLPANRNSVVATLYYQTTSKEYIDFLDSENTSGDGQGALMKSLWEEHGMSAPVAMVQETWIDTPSDIADKNLNKNYQPSSLKVFGPNPFNSQIKFEYYIAQNGMVNIGVYDISGSKVSELTNSTYSKGNYSIRWIADDYASGTYFIRLQAEDNIDIKKIILIK
ncbi:MAG: T9SS type A sorting domain-containing protein, partial [Calditrichaceae bacterium]